MDSKKNKDFKAYIFSIIAIVIAGYVYAAKIYDNNDEKYSKAQIAAMVAAEQGQYSQDITYRSYNGKLWTKPFFITNNRLNSATPAITADAKGNIWVMWSEANAKATELRYRIKNKENATWGEIKTFETGFGNNALPALITDKQGVLWSFWASVDGEDDEIFYSRYQSGSWDKPQRIAPDNKVPDIEAKVVLSEGGKPVVNWKSFDMTTFKYRNKVAEWNGKKWQQKGFIIDNPLKTNSLIKPSLPEGSYRNYSLTTLKE